jgi:phage protein D/phage baseplate assembly protein gpV
MSATDAERSVALYTILLGGAALDEPTSRRIREVKVLNYLRLPDMCTFTLTYEKGKEGQDEPIDSHPFDIGKSLEIKLGAREELTTSTLFKGEVVTLEVNFGPGSVELLVRGFDRSHVLLRSRRVKTFQNQTSSDIVSGIANAAGFTPRCDDSGEPHEFMEQDNETDWDFIWRLAERIGFEFVVEDKTAHFRRQAPDDPVELEWPTTLRSFRPRVTAIQQVGQVTLAAQDPKTKQAINVTATTPNQIAQIGVDRNTVKAAFDGDSIHVATEPVKSQSEGTALAQALLDKLANGYVAAEGVCDGNPAIRAGAALHVSGLGSKFSGLYRVAAATHVLSGGGTYETRFANSPAHTLLGSVGADRSIGVPSFGTQLAIGVVTNNSDPDSLGRVRVRYPALGPDAEGTWARIASVSAGNARGMMMLPVVGEEVLVGFEHGDTTRPYVLGSLFNGVDVPGDDLTQSKDGSFAVLSDQKIVATAKDAMSLTTKQSLTISADQNISETAQQAYNLETQQGDITIKADMGNITIQGQQSVTISCGASSIQIGPGGVTISGPMINLG